MGLLVDQVSSQDGRPLPFSNDRDRAVNVKAKHHICALKGRNMTTCRTTIWVRPRLILIVVLQPPSPAATSGDASKVRAVSERNRS